MLRSIYLLSFLLLQSLFAFAGNVKENVPSSFDLYVCIGQSNMAGRATLTPEVMDTLQNVYLLNDKGNFEPAVNPLNRYSTVRKDLSMQRLGPAYGFAKEMARQTKRPVGLVVNARGGSSIKSRLKGRKEGYYEEQARLENAVAVLKAREAAGLTQRDLAKKSGVPQSTIARIEKGANTSLTTMCKIAFALDKQVKISLV